MIWLVDGLLVSGTAFLLLFGEYIAGRIKAVREAKERRARYDARITGERHPARRAAWRTLRDNTDLENL